MPIFEYTALTETGQVKTGILDADTPRAARDKLRKDRVHVTSIQLAGDVTKGTPAASKGQGLHREIRLPSWMRRRSKESIASISNFTRQFATLLHAGTPLAESLQVLIDQASGRRFEATLRDIRERVTGGESLADALSNHPEAFNEAYINMVRAGEASGRLDEVLFRIGTYLQRQSKVRYKVVSALMYPMIMVCVGTLVVIVLMNFVVPKILRLIAAKGGDLPLPTRILQSVSNFFSSYWILLGVGVIGI